MLAGFQHSAFVFSYESMVHRNGDQERNIPPAGLISFVQKGIQYLELETNLNEVQLWPIPPPPSPHPPRGALLYTVTFNKLFIVVFQVH